MNQKIKYLTLSTRKFILGQGRKCPSCGFTKSSVVDKKYFVTALRRCDSCQLLFRTPTTTAAENASFYQENYTEGFTTEMPDSDQLQKLLSTGFKGKEKDYSRYIEILESLGATKGDALFDFGCSWGYGSWQFKQHGYEVESFEISEPRANYAKEKLGVKVHTNRPDASHKYDVFFSSHVIEHVPSIEDVVNYALKMLKPGGLFVALTPNGSQEHRSKNAYAWHKLWGLVHPNFLDKAFYEKTFDTSPYIMGSTPCNLEALREWSTNTAEDNQKLLDLSGGELLFAARVKG